MKKFRIAALVIFIAAITVALAVTASAKWWDENPFTDVKSSHWYYDAVRICNENEIGSVKKAVKELSKYIEQSIGISLPVVTDTAEKTDYEILVGNTNREVKTDISTLNADTEFICTVEGNTLILMGTDDTTDYNTAEDRSHHNGGRQYECRILFPRKSVRL